MIEASPKAMTFIMSLCCLILHQRRGRKERGAKDVLKAKTRAGCPLTHKQHLWPFSVFVRFTSQAELIMLHLHCALTTVLPSPCRDWSLDVHNKLQTTFFSSSLLWCISSLLFLRLPCRQKGPSGSLTSSFCSVFSPLPPGSCKEKWQCCTLSSSPFLASVCELHTTYCPSLKASSSFCLHSSFILPLSGKKTWTSGAPALSLSLFLSHPK